jgi:hypothetical protein
VKRGQVAFLTVIQGGEGSDNKTERKRKIKGKTEALKKGENCVATLLQRFTVRSLRYIRFVEELFLRRGAGEKR